MNAQPMEIRSGIFLFKGRISHNLALEPMISHTYFLEDGEEVIIFDPASGKETARQIETHIQSRRSAGVGWKRSYLIAGHSHMDHANDFYLSDRLGAPESHIYVHESGFQDGKVMNDAGLFIQKIIDESQKYYNFYLALHRPSLAALNKLSPALARRLVGRISSIVSLPPVNGSVEPESLKESDLQVIDLSNAKERGWKVGSMVILPTPGHSPCSVSLYWPERKALFVSDTDWIGNPVFLSSSLRDCISSLERLKTLAEAEKVDLLLPAHGQVSEGNEQVLSYLDFHIRLLEVMRDEVLSAYRACGKEKDVSRLTGVLAEESPLFRMLKLVYFPRFVVFLHNIVVVCLKEEGILN